MTTLIEMSDYILLTNTRFSVHNLHTVFYSSMKVLNF